MDKKQWQKLLKENSLIKEDTASEIDGKDKLGAVRYIRKKIDPLTKGFFKDESWEGVNKIWKEFEKMNLNWNTTKAEYSHDNDGTPNGKTWYFEIQFYDKEGKIKKINGTLRAAGAGSVNDPLDRYDIVVVL